MTNTKGESLQQGWVFAAICEKQQARTSRKKSKRNRINYARNPKQSWEEKWKAKEGTRRNETQEKYAGEETAQKAKINITIRMKKLLNRGKKAAQSTEARIIREEVKKKACHPAKCTDKLINVKWHGATGVIEVTKPDWNSNNNRRKQSNRKKN